MISRQSFAHVCELYRLRFAVHPFGEPNFSIILTWTVASLLACFCTNGLIRADMMKPSAHGPPPKESYLSISIKGLAEEIHEHVTKNKGSYVFSPYGLSHAMTVLTIGAVGETRSEITKVIFNGNDPEEMVSAHEVLASLNSLKTQSLQVQMTTLIAIHSNVKILPSYQQDVTNFKANYDQLDFMEKSAGNIINQHVEPGTNGSIPIFLDFNAELKPPAVLANAIAFNISWDRFDKAIRQTLPFRNIGGSVNNVTMITLDGIFEFKKFAFASMVVLPYADQYNIYLILPETPEQLPKVEDDIFKQFDAEVYGMKEEYLQVTIPKFKVDTFFNLNEAVKAIGVRTAFKKEGSELSKITKDNGFFLGEVFQRAVLEFGDRSSIPSEEPNVVDKSHLFLVDQPFFFVIRTKSHELNLFRGRVENID